MTEFDVDGLLHLLNKRRTILENILDGNSGKRELEDKLDISRPTIDRAFRNLEKYGVISSVGTEYKMTMFGKLIYEQFLNSYNIIEILSESQSVLEQLPCNFELPVDVLTDGSIHLSNPKVPDEPFLEAQELLQDSGSFVAMLPVVNTECFRTVFDSVIENGNSGELIVPDEVMEILFTNYRDKVETLLSTEHCSLMSTIESTPLGIIVFNDNIAWVGIYAKNGALLGGIVNDTYGAVEWAKTQFKLYRDRSNPVMVRGGGNLPTVDQTTPIM